MIYDTSLSVFHCAEIQNSEALIDYSTMPRPFCAITYIISGEAELISDDRTDTVRPGDLVYTHVGSCYRQVWKPAPDNRSITCQFIFADPPEPFARRRFYVQKLSGLADTLPDFEYMCQHYDEPSLYFDVMARFYRIMARIAPMLDGTELPPADPLISRALEYIEANCHKPLKIAQLAELCSLSESRFYTRFRESVGCTPIEYKHRAAIERAKRLLISEPDMTIEEISSRIGFESSSYSRRVFRGITGMSPGEYRAERWRQGSDHLTEINLPWNQREKMKLQGIQNGALLQRAGDSCETVLHTENTDTLTVSMGELQRIDDNTWLLSGIPTGGPYSVTFTGDAEKVTFTDIYVGDLWLLAGQSNMEGAGWLREKDEAYAADPSPLLRAFYMNDEWRPATATLHQLWESDDPAYRRTFAENIARIEERGLPSADYLQTLKRRRVGPGFFFAKELYRQTGVPQGVIPCAVGGAPIEMWIPTADGDNYYTAAYRRLIACGQRIRGIFWYQGEGFGGAKDVYKSMFESMRQGFSELCGTADLPTVMAQPFRCTIPGVVNSDAAERIWSRYRNYLRDICREGKNLSVVATNDLELDDCIHLSADAQEKLGGRAADAMRYLTDGAGCPEPEIETITVHPHPMIPEWVEMHITYRNLRGKLTSIGFPDGFMLSEGDEIPSVASIQHIALAGNEVRIRIELTPDALRQRQLWYGFGHHFHCTIIDEGGHPLLSQGPIPLSEFIP